MEGEQRNEEPQKPKRENCLTRRLRRMVRNVLKNNAKEKNTLPLIQFLKREELNIVVKGAWMVIFLLCWILFFYQTYDRICYYSTTPVSVDVHITRKEYAELPEITICYPDTPGVKELAQIEDADPVEENRCLAWNGPLFHMLSIGLVNTMEEAWHRLNTTPAVKSATFFNKSNSANLSSFEILLVHGTCRTFRTSKNEPLETIDGRYEIIMKLLTRKCTYPYYAQIYLHDSDESPNTRPYFQQVVGTVVEIGITLTEYTFVNRTRSICLTNKEFSRCTEECFLNHSLIAFPCRYPFHPKLFNVTVCNLEDDFAVWTASMAYMNGEIVVNCSCPRKCRHRTFNSRYSIAKSPNNISSSYILRFIEPYETLIEEVLIYTFIQLLCDIGGNSGLCIGLSVLSLFEIIQAMLHRRRKLSQFSLRDPLFCIVSKTYTDFNNSSEQTQQEVSKNLSRKSNVLKHSILVISLGLFISGTVFRIINYLQYPTRNIVNVSFNSTLIPPAVIICPGSMQLMSLQYEYASSQNISDPCDVNMWELMDLPGINSSYLWIDYTIYPKYSDRKKKPFVFMPDGTCWLAENGTIPVPALQAVSLTERFREKCEGNYIKVHFRSSAQKLEHFHYRYTPTLGYHDAEVGLFHTTVQFIVKEIIIDENRFTCVSEKEHEDCKIDCLQKELSTKIKCSLPYMLNSTLPTCDSSISAKHSHLTYLDLFVVQEKAMNCNCHPPCLKRLYETMVSSQNGSYFNTLEYVAQQNVVVSFLKQPKDSLAKLLCDLGGWLGSTLGLCLLSTFEIICTTAVKLEKSHK